MIYVIQYICVFCSEMFFSGHVIHATGGNRSLIFASLPSWFPLSLAGPTSTQRNGMEEKWVDLAAGTLPNVMDYVQTMASGNPFLAQGLGLPPYKVRD